MDIEELLFRRDRAEYFLYYRTDTGLNLKRQAEAEQEIERILRA